MTRITQDERLRRLLLDFFGEGARTRRNEYLRHTGAPREALRTLLAHALAANDEELFHAAVVASFDWPSPTYITTLLQALERPDGEVPLEDVIELLGLVGSPAANQVGPALFPFVQPLPGDESERARSEKALGALVSLRHPAAEGLATLVAASDDAEVSRTGRLFLHGIDKLRRDGLFPGPADEGA